jgi:cAMP-binding proteins - catabolite gene activator and regulatory subunit of cAMP-dependent protein kinases
MGLDDDIAFFERIPYLAALGKQALRILAIGAETRHLQSGAVLFYAGELADGGYVIQEGSLLLEPGTLPEGNEVTVGPGTLVGELALLTNTVCQATAIAKEPTSSCAYRAICSARCWKAIPARRRRCAKA